MREKHGRNPFPFSLFSHFGTKLPRAQSTKSFHFPNHLLIFASVLQLPFRVSLEKFGTLYFFYLRENETTAGFNGFKTPPSLSLVVVKEDIRSRNRIEGPRGVQNGS